MATPDAVAESAPQLRVLEGGRDGARPQRPTASAVDLGRRDARRLSLLAAALVVFGLVMVDAASPIQSLGSYHSVFSVVERQAMWAVLGTIAFVLAARWKLTAIRRRARLGLVLVGGLLFAVLVPHLGKGAGGSSRWIGAGPLTLQPSELAKLAFALFAADFVARRRGRADQRREIVTPLAVVVGAFGMLILKQPDLGTAMVVVAIAAAAWFAGGVDGRLLAATVAIIGGVGGVLALSASYRRARLLAFLNPFGHASTVGYQLVQSLSALGSGHLTGSAIATSPAAWFLPNASSDFIFAAVGNDFGLIGCLGVLVAIGAFGWLGVRIATRALDPFAAILAACLTCWVVFQAIVNVGGVVGVLPDTGIPLPFLSAGGSALIVVLAATGLLVNIARAPGQSTEAATQRAARRPASRPSGASRPSAARRPTGPSTPARRPVPSAGAPRRRAGAGGTAATAVAARRPRDAGRSARPAASERTGGRGRPRPTARRPAERTAPGPAGNAGHAGSEP